MYSLIDLKYPSRRYGLFSNLGAIFQQTTVWDRRGTGIVRLSDNQVIWADARDLLSHQYPERIHHGKDKVYPGHRYFFRSYMSAYLQAFGATLLCDGLQQEQKEVEEIFSL